MRERSVEKLVGGECMSCDLRSERRMEFERKKGTVENL